MWTLLAGGYMGLNGEASEPEPTTATGLHPLPGADLRGYVPLVKGDDYNSANGRAVVFTEKEHSASESWPDLTGATVTLRLDIAGTITSITGTVTTATGDEKQVSFNIAAASIATAGEGRFDVRAVVATRTLTLRQGRLTVYPNP